MNTMNGSRHGHCCCLFYLVVFVLLVTHIYSEKICARDKSRIVASIVFERVYPVFHQAQVQVDPECPFTVKRDMYALQERNKVIEGVSRVACDFCGKAFISEYFLDRHFENRHADKVQKEDDTLCLADVCDVFRCDIVSGAALPDYWDMALCLEEDMKELYTQCETLVDACIPKDISKNASQEIKGKVTENVCSFLRCSKFWNTPYEQVQSSHIALYIVLVAISCFAILIYNFVFYNYFYSDLADSSSYDPAPRTKHRIQPFRGGDKSDNMRRRHYNVT